VALAFLLAYAVVVGGGARAGAAGPQGVYLYGDSLMYEAAPTVSARIPGARFRAWGGMAPCTYRRQLEADLATVHPRIVVLETWGDTGGGCLTPEQMVVGSDAYENRIMTDFAAMFTEARAVHAKVLFVVGPPVYGDPMNRLQLSLVLLAASMHIPYTYGPRDAVGAATAVPALGGVTYRSTMRCLADETAAEGCSRTTGQIAVRSPDEIHFCPRVYANQADYLDGCNVYSSGAYRWGRAIANAVSSQS
jgi:hypothetical protein